MARGFDLNLVRELAGIQRDQPYVARGWYAPAEVTLDGTALRFSDELDGSRAIEPRAGMLTRFTALATAPESQILKFARTWGRLQLCRHGLPITHHAFVPELKGPLPMEYTPATGGRPLRIAIGSSGWGSHEPVAIWRERAQRMASVLELAARLATDDVADAGMWQRLGQPEDGQFVARVHPAVAFVASAGVASWMANLELDIAPPRVTVSHRGLALGDRVSGLPTALAMQLALAFVRGGDGFLPCSEPGCVNPARHPRAGALAYCQMHLNAGVRNRDVQRRHRQTVRARQVKK